MDKSTNANVIDGECELCGFPGIVSMTCSECGGTVIGVTTAKPGATAEDSDRYEDGLLDDATKVISLDDLKEEEATTEDSFDDL